MADRTELPPHALVEVVAATLHTLDGGDPVPIADVERAESVYRARAEMVLATIARFADFEGKPVVFGDVAPVRDFAKLVAEEMAEEMATPPTTPLLAR